MMNALLLALTVAAAPCADVRGEPIGAVGSFSRERARVLELAGLAPLRPRVFERWSSELQVRTCADAVPHPSEIPDAALPSVEVGFAPLTLRALGHGGWADDRNDGGVWAGKGLSTSVSGGVRARWRWFSAQLAPELTWQQNQPFPVRATSAAGLSPWSNPFNGASIDLPVRFGPDAFWATHAGQSWVRADAWNVSIGLSTENLWWGPGVRESLTMTNSAPGFAHVFVGTSRPADIWIGWLEVQALWGRLRESRWFDDQPENDRRLFSALTVGFEPKPVPGLFVGIVRTFQFTIPPGGVSWSDYVRPFFESYEKSELDPSSDDRGDNQLTSIFARWAFPRVGFEVYGEWGKDDHAWDWTDFVTHPGHGQAWLLGAHKAWRDVRGGVLRLSTELVNTFEVPAANPPRPVPVFYTHGVARQGYTHAGQMLGAGIGPQGNAQSLAVDWYGARSRVGVLAERRARNQRFFYEQISTFERQDVEIAAELRGTVQMGELEVDARLGAARRLNANFERSVGALRGGLTLTWMP
jgi:hypothetical protein